MPTDASLLESNNSLQSYLRSLKALRRTPETVRNNLHILGQFIEFTARQGIEAPFEVQRSTLTDYLVWMHERHAAHTVRVRYTVVRSWFRWLEAEGDIDVNPCHGVPLPNAEQVQKDVVTADDMGRVFQYLEQQKRWRDLAMLAILYDTGMRVGELVGLRRQDLSLDTGLVTIVRTTTKTVAGARVVRLSPAAVRHVDRYFRRRKDAFPWVVVGHKGALTRTGAYEIVRAAFEKAGVPGTIGPHDIRHTSASHVAGLLSESEMMALFGWKDSNMARYYAHEAMRKAALVAHEKASPMERLGRKPDNR